jgi:hypothetical protein
MLGTPLSEGTKKEDDIEQKLIFKEDEPNRAYKSVTSTIPSPIVSYLFCTMYSRE